MKESVNMTSAPKSLKIDPLKLDLLKIDAVKLLRENFHLDHFRPGQAAIIDSILQNQDTMAVMPTGGGKSLCYQLPAIAKKGITVVISPLIALMRDQVRSLHELNIAAGCLFSDQSADEKRKVFAEMKTAESFILFLSPERVQKTAFTEWLAHQNISLFAVDEAHCISQWGSDFREDYYRLSSLRDARPDVPILALTATATPMVLDDIAVQLKLKKPHRRVFGFYRPNLYYQVEVCDTPEEKLGFLKSALNQHPKGRVLVYCGTRRQAEELVSVFNSQFEGIDFYHAGLDVEKRNEIQKNFEKGVTRILFATNAFGMGINHPDVRLVVHFQMPANIESFYQEAGRAGRDGQDSTCLLLYTKKDKGLHSYFITQSTASKTIVNRKWESLKAITQFVEGGECRHSGILTYFRDTQRIKRCEHCDICLPDSRRKVLAPAQTEDINSIRGVPKSFSVKKRPAKYMDDRPLTADEELRSEVLKEWRKTYADANDVPAFMIFSNKTLKDLAIKNPQNASELQKVYGLGPHKIEHLGALILAELRSTH